MQVFIALENVKKYQLEDYLAIDLESLNSDSKAEESKEKAGRAEDEDIKDIADLAEMSLKENADVEKNSDSEVIKSHSEIDPSL